MIILRIHNKWILKMHQSTVSILTGVYPTKPVINGTYEAHV